MRQTFKLLTTISAVLFVTFFLTSCANTNKVTQDFKPDTDFSSYKTFSWHNFSSDVHGNDQIAIQHEIEQQLSQQGFQLVATNADVVLDLTIIKHVASASSTGVGLSVGLPIGRHGSIGLGTSKLLGKDEKFSALIILDITAKASNQVLWRGSADEVPLDYFTLRNQAKLNPILRDLVKQFPPKK
ncbi:MAG: DUF4136 domain-containing protein [Gammaproteobacteria bacterium]|nr:MAG: DUF4136 domain-containing protein [Gammaproteobacteria bacterium]